MTSSSSDVQVAWVTGSTRGIGLATARELAARGYGVIVHGRDRSVAESVADDLSRTYDVPTMALAFDLGDAAAPDSDIRRIKSEFGRLDVFVANAGVHRAGLIGMIGDEDIVELLEANVAGSIRCTQAAVRLMRRSGGSIILISSVMGTQGGSGQSLYSASKAALIGFGLAAAKELGPVGIRVNLVAPGFVETDMMADLDEATRVRRLGETALGRFASAEDVANLVGFLASDSASYITGQVIGVDGGLRV